MQRFFIRLSLLSVVILSVAQAELPVLSLSQSLNKCALILENDARLQCYDRLATTTQDAPVFSQPSKAPATPERWVKVLPERFESRAAGEFKGLTGRTIIELENGQRWQQTQGEQLYLKATSPAVVLEKTSFGGYRISIEGLNKKVRVKRLDDVQRETFKRTSDE